MSKLLKFSSYGAYFFVALLLFIYLNFPLNSLKPTLEKQMEVALGKGNPSKVGKHGVAPEVKIGHLSLYRLSGISMENVRIRLASKNPDPGASFKIDTLNARVGILSLLSKSKSVSFNGELYNGDFSGETSVGPKGQLEILELDLKKVSLKDLLFEYLPIAGELNADIELDLGENPDKEAMGKIEVKLASLVVGPGPLGDSDSMPSALKSAKMFIGELPKINFGDFDINLEIDKGEIKTDKIGMMNGDIKADIEIEGHFAKKVSRTRLDGFGWFDINEDFLKKKENSKISSAMMLGESFLRKSKDKEGKYHFNVKGTLAKPSFKLSKTNGKRKKSKKKK